MARGVHPNASDHGSDTIEAPAISTPTQSAQSPTIASSEYQPPTMSGFDNERELRYKAEAELAIVKSSLYSEREQRYKLENELVNTKAKLEAAEKALEELRNRHWTSHMMQAAEDMGPGGALIATVGAPVMAAPLAVATVVKGFQSVGTGIGSLFKGKAKDTPPPAASTANNATAAAQPGTTSPVVENFSFYTESPQGSDNNRM